MTKQNGSGYLRVWVTTGGQTFPVVGADVEGYLWKRESEKRSSRKLSRKKKGGVRLR